MNYEIKKTSSKSIFFANTFPFENIKENTNFTSIFFFSFASTFVGYYNP